MTVKKFSTKLNALTKYAPEIASTDKGKIKVFINDLISNIVRDIMKETMPQAFIQRL